MKPGTVKVTVAMHSRSGRVAKGAGRAARGAGVGGGVGVAAAARDRGQGCRTGLSGK